MKVKLIDLPKIIDPRGNLTFLQESHQIPFSIKRVFITHNVPGGAIRGGHAFKRQYEMIIALSGSFDIVVESSNCIEKFAMNRSYFGLLLPPLTWRHIENFSTNAISLHISSDIFDKDDYIRNYDDYLKYL